MNVLSSSLPLFIVPLLVVLGSLASLALSRGSGVVPARRAGLANAVGIVAAAIALLVAGRPVLSGARVYSHALRLFRAGSLDATLGFFLDARSLAAAVFVLAWGLALVLARPASGASSRVRAGVGLATAGLVTAAMAEGVPTLETGLVVFAATAAVTLGVRAPGSASRALGAMLGASAMLALGASLVFWGLGGRYLDGRRYLSDYRAPFEVSSKPAADGTTSGVRAPLVGQESYLTMTTRPGAKIYLGVANESQLGPRAEPFAVSPVFRAPLPAGLQKVAIDMGGGAIIGGDGREVALIEQARFPVGEEVEIRAIGPSLSFREIAAQIDKSPTGFAERQLGSFRIADAAAIALGLALLLVALGLGRSPRDGSSPLTIGFVGGGAAAFVGITVTQLGSVFDASPSYATLVALAAIAVALHAAVSASRALDASELVALAARASVALVLAAGLFVGFAPALGSAVATALALAVLGAVLERPAALSRGPSDRLVERGAGFGDGALATQGTALTLGVVALTGSPIPVAGAFVGLGAFGAAALSRGVLGVVVAIAAALAWAALAWASYRSYFCLLHAPLSESSLVPASTGEPEAGIEGPRADPPSASRDGDAREAAGAKKSAKKGRKQKGGIAKATDPAERERPRADRPDVETGRDRAIDLAGIAACVGGPVVALALGALDRPADQTTFVRALGYAAMAIPAAVAGHFARKRYGAERAAGWLAKEGARSSSETADDAGERPGRLATLGAAVVGVTSLPLDALASLVGGRARGDEEGA